jgi:hypothetical protein
VDEGLNFRVVEAQGRLRTPTRFMRHLGVDSLPATTSAVAEQAAPNIEISLVLDISGSMRWGPNDNKGLRPNRIESLRLAVEDFVDIVLGVSCDPSTGICTQSPDTVSTTINVIPYAGNVNPGPELFSVLSGDRWHNWSSCLEISSNDFANANLPSADSRQLPHFMKWTINTTWMD